MVMMIVFMSVKRERAAGTLAEEPLVFRVIAHQRRRALAADMAVHTNHAIRGAHHHMEIVADHENGRACVISDLLDQAVESGFAWLVQALGGFVQDQEIGATQQSAGEEDTLQLAA